MIADIGLIGAVYILFRLAQYLQESAANERTTGARVMFGLAIVSMLVVVILAADILAIGTLE